MKEHRKLADESGHGVSYLLHKGFARRGFGELKLGDGGIAKASVKKRDSQIEPETG